MASKFIGSTKSFGAARELAGVWLFAGVRSDMAGLVLESVECLVAQRTFVGARQVGSMVVLVVHGHIHGRSCSRRRGHRSGSWPMNGLRLRLL